MKLKPGGEFNPSIEPNYLIKDKSGLIETTLFGAGAGYAAGGFFNGPDPTIQGISAIGGIILSSVLFELITNHNLFRPSKKEKTGFWSSVVVGSAVGLIVGGIYSYSKKVENKVDAQKYWERNGIDIENNPVPTQYKKQGFTNPAQIGLFTAVGGGLGAGLNLTFDLFEGND